MTNSWRISTVNGALLVLYFIPAWTFVAFKIVASPVHGLYDLANVSVALFLSDHLDFAKMDLVRLAWLLALCKMTVVAFFAVFLVMTTRASVRKSGSFDEALALAARHRQPHRLRQHGDGVTNRRNGRGAPACDRTAVATWRRHPDGGRAAVPARSAAGEAMAFAAGSLSFNQCQFLNDRAGFLDRMIGCRAFI